MPTRRALLGTTALGLAGALSGCSRVLPGGGSGTGSFPGAFLSDPNLASTVDRPGWSPETAYARVEVYRLAALRDRDAPFSEEAVGNVALTSAVPGPEAEAFESVERTVVGECGTYFQGGQVLRGIVGYAAGSVDPEAYRRIRGVGEPEERHRGYGFYPQDIDMLSAVSETGIAGVTVPYPGENQVAEGTEVGVETFRRGLLRRVVDRAEGGPEMDDWAASALDRIRPFQYASIDYIVGTGESPGLVLGTSLDVRGEETTVTSVAGYPSASAFEDAWDPEDVERDVAHYTDDSVEVARYDTAGVASGTVPTSETFLAARPS